MCIRDRFTKILTPREEQVIRLAFGFDHGYEHTVDQIGQLLGVSGSRVGQIRAKAERKLRHPSVAGKIINTGFGEVYTKVKLTKEQLTKAESKLENDKGEKYAHNI